MEGFRLVKKEIIPAMRGEVEENTTFYYSNFKLFTEQAEFLVSKYISFKKDLQAFLGDEWQNYASKSVFKTEGEATAFVHSQHVFNAALEVWLELRKEIKFEPDTQSHLQMQMPQKNLIITRDPSSFSQDENEEEKKSETSSVQSIQNPSEKRSEDDQLLEAFMKRTKEKFTSFEINEMLFKVIIQAFNVSATKLWKEMTGGFFGESTQKNEGFLIESKKFLLNKLNTFYNTKSKMLKPILVATERIKDYVLDSTKFRAPIQIQMPDERELRNISNFSSSLPSDAPSTPSNDGSVLDDEQDMKRNFKQLQISSKTTTESSLLGKRSSVQANTVVEIKKINKKLEKMLNPHTIEFAAYYVNNMVKTSNTDWQVSRNFVTKMVEVNYNKLVKLENQIGNKNNEIGADVRVRFIQPAQEFYNRLMEIWIVFKTQSLDREILFTEYLEKVKTNLGNLWNERYMAATQNFFMTLYYEWSHLRQIDNDTEQKVLQFTKKVKESMLKIWEENIVKKAEELSNKTMNC